MIKEYVKLIISDIKADKKFFILLTIQTLIAFIVIGNIIGIANYTNDTIENLDSFNFSDKYYGKISTEIYTFSGITVTEMDIETERKLSYYIAENYKASGYSNNYIEAGENSYNMTFVSEDYFDIYKLETESGRLFLDEEYHSNTMENTPVILGNYYKGTYKVGDMYLDKYKVVGILKGDQYTINLEGEKSRPVSTDLDKLFPVKSLSCMIQNHYEYPSSLIYSDDKAQLKAINDYAEKLGIYPFNFISLSGTKQIINNMSTQTTAPLIIISFIIITLAIFCLIQSAMLFIRRNLTELLIHRICGAKLSNILLRVSAGSFIVIFTSGVVASLIFRTVIAATGIAITGVAVLLITIIPFAVKLKRLSILSSIREGK